MSRLDDLLVEKADLEDEIAELKDRGGRNPDYSDTLCRLTQELDDVKYEIAELEDRGDFDDGDVEEEW